MFSDIVEKMTGPFRTRPFRSDGRPFLTSLMKKGIDQKAAGLVLVIAGRATKTHQVLRVSEARPRGSTPDWHRLFLLNSVFP